MVVVDLLVGAQRGSPFRMKIGAPIILPMPNNIQDTNQRVWEESSMNNQLLDAIRKSAKNTLFKSLLSDVGLGDIEQVLLTHAIYLPINNSTVW